MDKTHVAAGLTGAAVATVAIAASPAFAVGLVTTPLLVVLAVRIFRGR